MRGGSFRMCMDVDTLQGKQCLDSCILELIRSQICFQLSLLMKILIIECLRMTFSGADILCF